ncbi:MAG: hypothetical protein MAG451_02177 [Anaerolineales bacterium]|nr:hypothetical protein [Anaerolineales bacterium]
MGGLERNNYPNLLPLDCQIQAERNGTFYFFHIPKLSEEEEAKVQTPMPLAKPST